MTAEEIDHPLDDHLPQRDSAGNTRQNLILGGLWIVFGVVLFFAASAINIYQGSAASQELGPRFWPQMLGVLLTVVGSVLLIQAWRGKTKDVEMEPVTKSGIYESILVVVILILQTIAWAYFGFLISALVALIILPLALGSRKPIRIILFSVGVVGLLYVLFAIILRIPL